jgi:Family of unknown function (DUF6312)
MADLRFGDQVRSVIRLTRTATGEISPEVLYERAPKTGKKKSSSMLKPAQRLIKQTMEAQQASATRYLERHAKSNQKRRDGWLVDFPSNVARATRAGQKKIKVRRLILG